MAVKTYTFDKEFEELRGLENRFDEVKEKVNNPDCDYEKAFKELLKVACLTDHLSEHKYTLIVSRLERAIRYKKELVINHCVEYVSAILRLTNEYLTLKLNYNMLQVE